MRGNNGEKEIPENRRGTAGLRERIVAGLQVQRIGSNDDGIRNKMGHGYRYP
jgi:hypothetical protein